MAKDVSDQELDRLLDEEEKKIKREREEMKKHPSPSEKPGEGPKKEPGKPGEKPEKPDEARPGPAPVMGEYNPWGILLYPHLAEKSMNMVEMENKLVFIVSRKANKKDIKEAVEKGFDVRVSRVKTEITTKGLKKAYIKLAEGYEAADVASRLGMI
jgi:large subunit ribosomal protein L23